MTDHLSPARPFGTEWRRISSRGLPPGQKPWARGDVLVISQAEMTEYRGVLCPHNHVSVSVPRGERRPSDEEMAMVRRNFDMDDAEEDNHHPGRIRNLFLPLHLPRGTVGICDCKSDETVVVEPDGFQWSKPR